jgi:hypothetical protein
MNLYKHVSLEDKGLCYLIKTEAPLRKNAFYIEKVMEAATKLPKRDEILLDLSRVFMVRNDDIDILKELDRAASEKYNFSFSLVNPKPNVRCFMKNMKLNEDIALFDSMEHYKSLRDKGNAL